MKAVEKFDLTRIKTGDILVKAYHYEIMTEHEGNELWEKMLNQKRYLSEKSFTHYLKNNPDILF